MVPPRGTLKDGSVDIVLPARTWQTATDVVLRVEKYPPDGYKLMAAKLNRRSKSGQRVNLRLEFRYCDSREPEFQSAQELEDHFVLEAEMAQRES